MSDLVPPDEIEGIVGHRRHLTNHYGRVITDTQMVYILHSHECKDSGIDLRTCRYSLALDRGLRDEDWAGHSDQAVPLIIYDGRLVPLTGL